MSVFQQSICWVRVWLCSNLKSKPRGLRWGVKDGAVDILKSSFWFLIRILILLQNNLELACNAHWWNFGGMNFICYIFCHDLGFITTCWKLQSERKIEQEQFKTGFVSFWRSGKRSGTWNLTLLLFQRCCLTCWMFPIFYYILIFISVPSIYRFSFLDFWIFRIFFFLDHELILWFPVSWP